MGDANLVRLIRRVGGGAGVSVATFNDLSSNVWTNVSDLSKRLPLIVNSLGVNQTLTTAQLCFYHILSPTASGITITLPASPPVGSWVVFRNTSATNSFTVGTTSISAGDSATFVFVAPPTGWLRL